MTRRTNGDTRPQALQSRAPASSLFVGEKKERNRIAERYDRRADLSKGQGDTV
jgi:hypothetical protein